MGIIGITAFGIVARSLRSLVPLATLSFLYTVQAQAGEVSLAWDGSTRSRGGWYQLHYGLTSGSYTSNVDAGKDQLIPSPASRTAKSTTSPPRHSYNSGRTIWSGFSNEVSATTAPAPVASFPASPTLGTARLTITFTDTSTGNVTSRSRNFGDGTTSTAKSYTNRGAYTATPDRHGLLPSTSTTLFSINAAWGIKVVVDCLAAYS